MRVPGFLARQFIVPGSLVNTETGLSVGARNPIGDGQLVGIGHIRIDGVDGLDDGDNPVSLEDLERHGPGLIVDGRDRRRRGRLLAWIE